MKETKLKEIETKGHLYYKELIELQGLKELKKDKQFIPSIDDFRKDVIQPPNSKPQQGDLNTQLSELAGILKISDTWVEKWKREQLEVASFMTGIEFLINYLAVDVSDLDSLNEIFQDGPFLIQIMDLYNGQPVSLQDAVAIVLHSWVLPISKEKIDKIFQKLDPTNSLATVRFKHTNCLSCSPEPEKLLIKGYHDDSVELLDELCKMLLEGEVLVYHGSNSPTWLNWLNQCTFTTEISTIGDFHNQDQVAYFVYKWEAAISRAWKPTQTGCGYLLIAFAMKRESLYKQAYYYKYVGIKELERVVRGFRTGNDATMEEYSRYQCIEGPMLANPQDITSNSWKSETLDELGNHIFVKN